MYYGNCKYREDLAEAVRTTVNIKKLFGKTFLITGASGLIASFLVDLLFYANETIQAGIRVYAMVRDRVYAEQRYRSIIGHPNFHLVVQDVCEPLTFTKKVDYVIHAAGDGYPQAFRQRPVETMLPALVGTIQLLEYMKRIRESRFLYLSSGEVYGIAEVDEFVETYSGYLDTMKSRSCYPSAKRAAETLCAAYHAEYNIDTVVVRLSHVYGPNTSQKDNRATAQFFRNVLERQDVALKSQGKQMRSYTYVADCVSAMLTVLINGQSGEVYNISNPAARATIAEFAKIIAESGAQKCVYKAPDKDEEQENTPIPCAVLNSEKLQGLGWQGRYSVSRGIQNTLQILEMQRVGKADIW